MAKNDDVSPVEANAKWRAKKRKTRNVRRRVRKYARFQKKRKKLSITDTFYILVLFGLLMVLFRDYI